MKYLLLIAMTISFGFGVHAADVKFGYVDMQKAMLATKAGQAASKNLDSEISKRKKSVEKMRADFTKMQKDFEAKVAVLSDDAKQRKAQEMQNEALKIQKAMYENEQALRKKDQSLKKPILDGLQKSIESVAKSGKYTMIFEGSRDKILWAEKEVDITDEVVSQFEKLQKKK